MTDEEFMVLLKDASGRAIVGAEKQIIAYSEVKYGMFREIGIIKRSDLLDVLFLIGEDLAGKARRLVSVAFLLDGKTVEGMTIDGRTAIVSIDGKYCHVKVKEESRLKMFWEGYLHGYRSTSAQPARAHRKVLKTK